MFHNQECVHKRGVCKDHVGHHQRPTLIFPPESRHLGLCPRIEFPILNIVSGRHHRCHPKCHPNPTSNVPQRVANADNTSGTFWSATPGHTTNSMGFPGPGTASSCSYREGTTPPDTRGYTPPKDQAFDGPLPQIIQQLCQPIRHPHVVGQTYD